MAPLKVRFSPSASWVMKSSKAPVSGVMARSAAVGGVLSMTMVCAVALLLPSSSVTMMVRSWTPSGSGKTRAKAWSSPAHVVWARIVSPSATARVSCASDRMPLNVRSWATSRRVTKSPKTPVSGEMAKSVKMDISYAPMSTISCLMRGAPTRSVSPMSSAFMPLLRQGELARRR